MPDVGVVAPTNTGPTLIVRPVDVEEEEESACASVSGPGSEKRTRFLVRWGVLGGVDRPVLAKVRVLLLLVLVLESLFVVLLVFVMMLRRGRRTARGASSMVVSVFARAVIS